MGEEDKGVPSVVELLEEREHAHEGSAQAAVMIWFGILIDAVPESVVLGVLASTASQSSLVTFVIGVFLSNLPEAMSSSGTMKAHGEDAEDPPHVVDNRRAYGHRRIPRSPLVPPRQYGGSLRAPDCQRDRGSLRRSYADNDLQYRAARSV